MPSNPQVRRPPLASKAMLNAVDRITDAVRQLAQEQAETNSILRQIYPQIDNK